MRGCRRRSSWGCSSPIRPSPDPWGSVVPEKVKKEFINDPQNEQRLSQVTWSTVSFLSNLPLAFVPFGALLTTVVSALPLGSDCDEGCRFAAIGECRKIFSNTISLKIFMITIFRMLPNSARTCTCRFPRRRRPRRPRWRRRLRLALLRGLRALLPPRWRRFLRSSFRCRRPG